MKIRLSSFSGAPGTIAGFSLIEATIGFGIIGTLVGALLSGFTSGLFTMQMARENLRATQILLERMETIRLYSWDEISAPSFVSPTFSAYYDPTCPTSHGVTYSGTITLAPAPVSSSYSNNMKIVTVKLNWKTGNLDRSREFTSYISRCGIQNYIY